jgi:DNA-binding MarR family transcriptional regulator
MNDGKDQPTFNERIANSLRDVTLSYYRFTALASQEAGVGISELMALGYLRDRGALRAGQLGERLGLTTGAMTALLDRLERVGYARRIPHPKDRRSILVELTDRGRAEVGSLFELLTSNVDRALKGATTSEREAVFQFLVEIDRSFERRGEEAMPD